MIANRCIVEVDRRDIGLKEVEDRIVRFVNRIGSLLVDRVVQEVNDPVTENRVWVVGKRQNEGCDLMPVEIEGTTGRFRSLCT